MIIWHTTPNLVLDVEGILWHWTDPDCRRLGPVEDVAPDLADEADECLDLWRDAFDARAEADWSYRQSVFPRIW